MAVHQDQPVGPGLQPVDRPLTISDRVDRIAERQKHLFDDQLIDLVVLNDQHITNGPVVATAGSRCCQRRRCRRLRSGEEMRRGEKRTGRCGRGTRSDRLGYHVDDRCRFDTAQGRHDRVEQPALTDRLRHRCGQAQVATVCLAEQLVTAREQDDRQSGQLRVGADLPGDIATVHDRHAHVQQHQVERLPGPLGQQQPLGRQLRLLADLRLQPPSGELSLQDFTVRRVVIDDQDTGLLKRAKCPPLLVDDVRRTVSFKRQLEEERRPGVRLAIDLQFAAHQMHQLTADRQPQPGPSIPPRRRGVGLGERVEHSFALLGRHPDSGVLHGEPKAGGFRD